MTAESPLKTNGIQVIARAAAILRVLGQEEKGLSLGKIAQRVDLPRSTVQRIIAALADERLVSTEEGDGGIRLGAELFNLAQASRTSVTDHLRWAMKQIAEETGETVDLAVLEGEQMRFVDQIVGKQRLRTASSIGERFPVATTANGKAALACLSEEEAANVLMKELGVTTVRSKAIASVLEQVAAIRAGELARDIDEHTDGISALGYALKGHHGQILALSVPVPSSRFARIESELSEVLLASRDTFAG